VKWAGNPYEKVVQEGTEGYLEPRKSFKTWSETVVGRCTEWTEEEVETAAVLCLVYGKFIEVWRQKEAALQNSQLTKLLLANSAHEVRTPLNAIINYLEIAMEGALDSETRENLSKSHSASKSLIYVINDLLDLTKTEEGFDLIKGESFDLKATLKEATESFTGDAKRKGIKYEVIDHPGLPNYVIGDQRRVRQAISNVTANAIQHTSQGSVKVEMYLTNRSEQRAEVEVVVTDTGIGMSDERVDNLFRDLEQVQSDSNIDPFSLESLSATTASKQLTGSEEGEKRTLGLGLAVVARIIRNMNGQMRLKSEAGAGSRFVLQFPFDLPDSEATPDLPGAPVTPVTTPGGSEAIANKPEVTLIKKDSSRTRRSSASSGSLQRRTSAESINSLGSKRSMKSQGSGHSGRSDVDRLIEAIQEPHMTEEKKQLANSSRASWSQSGRPGIEKRHSYAGGPASPMRRRAVSTEQSLPENRRSLEVTTPGEERLPFTNHPLRAIKVPDDEGTPWSGPAGRPRSNGSVIGEVTSEAEDGNITPQPESEAPKVYDALKMHVLVAEDDPINSKILKKRMENKGHIVHLTTNGEECATAYTEDSAAYDLVLMDMQVCAFLTTFM
jgi:signal transduction histidine kinase/CheY-like chemotaxis protein